MYVILLQGQSLAVYLGFRCAVLGGRIRESVIRSQVIELHFRSGHWLHGSIAGWWSPVVGMGHWREETTHG